VSSERYDPGTLPNLIVIGAMKCATTALHRNLRLHPQLSMSYPKELRFFIEENPTPAQIASYKSHFDPSAPVRGESTPGYSKRLNYPGLAERIAEMIPEARLIYIVRDPLDRLCSHWRHLVAAGRESRPLERCLEDLEGNPLVDPSLYRFQLDAYLRHFPLERIHLTTLDALRKDPDTTMREIFSFLAVDPGFTSPRFQNPIHVSDRRGRVRLWARPLQRQRKRRLGRLRARPLLGPLLFSAKPVPRPVVSDALRRRLADRFRDDVAGLRELTGQAFSDWSL
jgi:hypothetical protein